MPSEPPKFVKPKAQAVPEAKLAAMQKLAVEAREAELKIDDLEEQIQVLQARLNIIQTKELPDALEAVHMDHFGVPAIGNRPAFDVELKPFYSANIQASWDDAKRKEGFDYLDEIGEGDLIKTEITSPFPREKRKDALALSAKLAKAGYTVTVKENVHNQTLTAWLKRKIEDEKVMPNLAKIGGIVGQVAKIKERKTN